MISVGKNHADALREYKRGTSQDRGGCFCGIPVAASWAAKTFLCLGVVGRQLTRWVPIKVRLLVGRSGYWLAVSPPGSSGLLVCVPWSGGSRDMGHGTESTGFGFLMLCHLILRSCNLFSEVLTCGTETRVGCDFSAYLSGFVPSLGMTVMSCSKPQFTKSLSPAPALSLLDI